MNKPIKIGKLEMACCPECNKWYARNTMVVVNRKVKFATSPLLENEQTEVCVDCYEEKYFIPPKGLREEEHK